MKLIKVLSIFGTRPEAVKMAPVVRELARSTSIEAKVCVTAQHREMLDQVLDIVPVNRSDILKPKCLEDLPGRDRRTASPAFLNKGQDRAMHPVLPPLPVARSPVRL